MKNFKTFSILVFILQIWLIKAQDGAKAVDAIRTDESKNVAVKPIKKVNRTDKIIKEIKTRSLEKIIEKKSFSLRERSINKQQNNQNKKNATTKVDIVQQNFDIDREIQREERKEKKIIKKITEDHWNRTAEKWIREYQRIASNPILRYSKKVLMEYNARVVGGENAQPGEWPWQALIRAGNGLCGGVLIHSCYVLTARHCTNVDKSQITVTLGEHNRLINENTEQIRSVVKIIRHPTFDAALLLLDTATDTSQAAVSTINLASTLPPPGTSVTVTGWGWMASGVSSVATVLQELQLPITNWNTCAAQLNPIFANVGANPLQSHEVCAGDPNGNYGNACHDDSGGPLVWFDGSQWQLVGIVNRGAPGCPSNVDYAVYLSIPDIRNWILDLLPSSQGVAGQRCNCLHPVEKHDGTLVTATYDGANCYIGPAHPGCSPGQSPNDHQAFIYQNRYYEVSQRAIFCPEGWFDSCNCYLQPVPTTPAGVNDFIWSNNFYLSYDSPTAPKCNIQGNDDGANCYVRSAPWATTAFKWSTNWYSTARPTCNSPFTYDGANCYYQSLPSFGTPFIWNNGYYTTPGPGNTCPPGSTYDGANCFFRKAPWGTQAFVWGGNWYHTPGRQCQRGSYDGANCLLMYPPPGATAFIWGGNYYYGWL